MKSLTLILSLGLLFLSQLALSQDSEDLQKSKNLTATLMTESLREAVEAGDLEKMQSLIDQGANINAQDEFLGWTPLHIAFAGDYIEAAELLIENGADVNLRDKTNRTFLHFAAYKNNTAATKLLIKSKVDINALDRDNKTSLDLAIERKSLESVKILKAHGALIGEDALKAADLKKALNKSLREAVEVGDLVKMQKLIDQGADINAQEKLYKKNAFQKGAPANPPHTNGNSLLHIAAYNGDAESIKLLAENGADINIQNKKGQTALYYAVHFGFTKIVKVLIKNEVDINTLDIQNKTPLDVAIFRGHTELEKLLKEHGALTGEDVLNAANLKDTALTRALIADVEVEDVEVKELAGEAFRKEAIKGKNIDELQNLINQGVIDTDAQNDKGQILLHVAIADGQTRSAELLMNENNVNAQDDKGETPLHAAVYINNIFLIKPLLKYKADINIKSLDGSTPVHIAAIRGRVKAMKLLAENKADINAQNKKGQTALDLAVLHDHPDVAELLKKLGALTSEELLKTANLKGVSTKSKTAKTKAAKTKAKTKTKKSTKNQSSCKGIFKA